MAQAKLRITGFVQGVFYRDSARTVATELDLSGYAKNMPDGSVESVVAGSTENINKYAQWCETGPEMARVENVTIEWTNEDTKKDTFEIF
mgnify:CR=1 FL=1